MLTQDMGRRLQARAIGDPNHADEVFGRDTGCSDVIRCAAPDDVNAHPRPAPSTFPILIHPGASKRCAPVLAVKETTR